MDRFCEVTDKVFRGSCPTPEELKGLKDIFGIKRIISLDGPLADQLASHCKNLNIEQIKLPIEFDNFGPMLQKLKEDIVPMLLDNQPCFIHCRHGKDRTGTAVALYRIQGEGWSPKDALKEAEEFDFGSGLQPEVLKFYTDLIMNCENDIEEPLKKEAGLLKVPQEMIDAVFNWCAKILCEEVWYNKINEQKDNKKKELSKIELTNEAIKFNEVVRICMKYSSKPKHHDSESLNKFKFNIDKYSLRVSFILANTFEEDDSSYDFKENIMSIYSIGGSRYSKTKNELLQSLRELKDTIEHELSHYIQNKQNKKLNIDNFGILSKNIITDKDSHNYFAGVAKFDENFYIKEKEHHLIEGEFYPVLKDEISEFKNFAKDLNENERQIAIKLWVGELNIDDIKSKHIIYNYEISYSVAFPRNFFTLLKEHEPLKYKKAVKEFVKAVQNNDDSNDAYDSDSTVGGLQQQTSFAPMGQQPYIRMAQEDKNKKKKEKLKKLLEDSSNDSNDADIQGNVPITGQTDNNGILGGNYVENARQRFPWTIT